MIASNLAAAKRRKAKMADLQILTTQAERDEKRRKVETQTEFKENVKIELYRTHIVKLVLSIAYMKRA